MTLTPLVQYLLVAAFWVLLVLVATYTLRRVCDFFCVDSPSPRRALFMSVFVAGAAYLAIEYTGYVIMRAMDDTVVFVPEWYGFGHWLREPVALKWAILGKVPFVRWLPFVVGLCAAGFLQTLLLELRTPFRMATFLFLMQWSITIVFMGLFTVAVNFALRQFAHPPEQPAPGHAAPQVAKTPGPTNQAPKKGPSTKQAPKQVAKQPVKQAPKQPPPQAAAEGSSLAIREKLDDAEVTAGQLWERFRGVVDPHLDEVKEALEPVTRHLPEGVHELLDRGGWWVLVAIVAVLAIVWLRKTLQALRRLFRPRRKKRKKRTIRYDADLREDISELAHVYTDEPAQQVTVKGVPARLRLVVLSQATKQGQGVSEDMVDPLFDWMRPGLAAVAGADYPRVRLWPPYPSADGFDLAFAQNVQVPGGAGQRGPWVLVSGRVQVGGQKINVGLALLTDQPTSLRHLKVGTRWLDVLGVQKAAAGVGV
jgi:hypothetical protein